MKRFGKIALGALMLGGAVAATTVPADARVVVGVGIGVPVGGYYGGYGYGAPYYGYPYYGGYYGYAPVAYGYYGPRVWWHGRYVYRHPYYHRGWHRW